MDAREDWLRKRPAASKAETEAVLPLPLSSVPRPPRQCRRRRYRWPEGGRRVSFVGARGGTMGATVRNKKNNAVEKMTTGGGVLGD